MTVNKQKNWQAIVYSKMSNRTTGSWIEIIPRIQCMPLYDQLLCTLTTWHCFKHCWFTTGSWKKCFWHPWIFLYQQNGNPANINQYTSQCCVVGQLDGRPWQVHINVAKLTLQQWRTTSTFNNCLCKMCDHLQNSGEKNVGLQSAVCFKSRKCVNKRYFSKTTAVYATIWL